MSQRLSDPLPRRPYGSGANVKESGSNPSIAARAVRVLFAPSVALMGGLPFLWKFALTGLLLGVPLLFVLFHYVVELHDRIEFSAREVKGLRLLHPARDLMFQIASSRQSARPTAEGELPSQPARGPWLDQLEATTDQMLAAEHLLKTSEHILGALQTFRDDLRLAREQWKAFDSPDSDDVRLVLIRKVQALILVIGNNSNLILDPDLDTYYLMDHTVLKLPERLTILTELSNRLDHDRSRGTELASEDHEELVQVTELLRANCLESRQGIQFALDNNPAGNLRQL